MAEEKKQQYEAPRILDLEELDIKGEFPLGTEQCSAGSGGTTQGCYAGPDPL